MLRIGFALVLGVALVPTSAFAHRSGCHRWHTCPSDTGSYIVGDPPLNVPPPPVNSNSPASSNLAEPDKIIAITDNAANIVVQVLEPDLVQKPSSTIRVGRIKRGAKLRVTGKTLDEKWWRVDYQATEAWVPAESVDYTTTAQPSAPAASVACSNVCITAPATDSVLRGTVDVWGTAKAAKF